MTIRVTNRQTGVDFQPLLSPSLEYTQESRTGIMQPVNAAVPYTTLRFLDSRSGTFEFVFANRAGLEFAQNAFSSPGTFLYENTDQSSDPIRRNLHRAPRALGMPVSGATGTLTDSTTGTLIPGEMMDYRRFVSDAVIPSGSFVSIGDTSAVDIPVTPGESIEISVYGFSTGGGIGVRAYAYGNDGGGTPIEDYVGSTVTGSGWRRATHTFFVDPGVAVIRPVASFPITQDQPAGTVLGAGALLVERPGSNFEPWFDGDYSPGGGSTHWLGATGSSESAFVPDAAEMFAFVTAGPVVYRRNMPYKSWTLRVPFREVSL